MCPPYPSPAGFSEESLSPACVSSLTWKGKESPAGQPRGWASVVGCSLGQVITEDWVSRDAEPTCHDPFTHSFPFSQHFLSTYYVLGPVIVAGEIKKIKSQAHPLDVPGGAHVQ